MDEKERELESKSINKPEQKCCEPDKGHAKGRFKPPAGFSRELLALTHVKVEKPADCQICFYRFCNGTNLKRHLDRFKDQKYPCDECGTKFRDAHLLRSHILHAHEFFRLKKPFAKCPVCNQRFALEMSFRSHLCHYHGEWVDGKIGKFGSKSWSDVTETGSTDNSGDTDDSGDELSAPMKARKWHLLELIKDIAKTTSEDNKEPTLSKNNTEKNDFLDGKNTKSEWKTAPKSYEMAEAYDRKIQREVELRMLYSCKDCYVPLPRIEAKRKRPMESATSTYRDDDAKRRRKTKKRAKQSQSKHSKQQQQQQQQKKNDYQSQLPLFEMPPVTFFSSNDLLKSRGNDYEMAYEASYAPDESVDPLDVGHESVESTMAEQPTESCDLSTPNIPVKVEPMDCGIDEESSAEASNPPNHPDQNEAMTFLDMSYTGFEDQRVALESDTQMKIEIDEHPIDGHSDPGTDNDATEAESLGTPDEDSLQMEPLYSLPNGEDKATEAESDRVMLASRVCNKLFANKRMMLRHCRDSHLLCNGDTVRCTCGKTMIGRRALEIHFSRHCYRLVKTQRPESNLRTTCKPLDKRYMCAKCGERFWLESCCSDHPPNCELHKVQPQQPQQQQQQQQSQQQQPKPNLDAIHKSSVSHHAETGEYVCQICGSTFMTIETLMKHIRMFAKNGKHPCPICRTVFPSPRLLRGHIHSTHMPSPATPYPHTCPICHQGFTKNYYRRAHMMHIHAKVTTKRSSNLDAPHNDHQQRVSSLGIEDTNANRCSLCNLVFVSHKRYVDHVDYFDKSAVVRCNICGKAFAGRYNAHHHRKKMHYAGNVRNSYAHCCDICGEGFVYRTHLHAHMVHVHGKKMGADVAPRTAVRSEENECSIDDELEKEVPKKPGWKCSRCGMEFLNWSGWNFHVKNAHPTAAPIDTSSFSTKRDVTITDPSPSIDLPCVSVDSSVDDSKSSEKCDNLVDPTTGILTPRRMYEVENIETSTSAKKAPNGDVLEAMKDLKSSQCTICGFNCPDGLNRHKAMFANSGYYSCEFCGRRFGWQIFYRDHKLKHFRRDVQNNCFCPVCDEGFDNIEFLEMHTIHLHQQTLEELRYDEASNDPLSVITLNDDAPKETSSSLQPTTCNICRMVFVNNEKLNNHRKNYHSLPEAKNPTTRKRSNNGDRFYLFAGVNAQTQIADNIGQNGSIYHVGMTNNLYRYQSSFNCKYCNITFTSKDELNVHHKNFHKIQSNVETQLPEIRPIEVSSRNSMQLASSGSKNESHGKSKEASQKLETEGSKRVDECSRVMPILKTYHAKTSQAILCNKVVNTYQCRDCDIIFVDKNLLVAHERNVHHLISRIDELSDRPVPTTQPPQEITISDEDTERKLSAASKNTLSIDKMGKKPPTRLVPLPPGQYKIAKLKVRSADTTIGKVIRTLQLPPLKKL